MLCVNVLADGMPRCLIATMGSLRIAVARPATFEQPDRSDQHDPAFDVMRPIPDAMKAAFCSCRQTTVLIVESRSVSKTLSILAPGMPKTYCTPWASRLRTSSFAPVSEPASLFAVAVIAGSLSWAWSGFIQPADRCWHRWFLKQFEVSKLGCAAR
jgi:hypothetical protein